MRPSRVQDRWSQCARLTSGGADSVMLLTVRSHSDTCMLQRGRADAPRGNAAAAWDRTGVTAPGGAPQHRVDGMDVGRKRDIEAKVEAGERLGREDGVALYECDDLAWLGGLAHAVRTRKNGDRVFFNVNLHLNL